MTDCYFSIEPDDAGEWIKPTEFCRGPWDPDACHAGPPSGMIARASERLVPGQRLARLTVDLTRPVPLAGFRIVGEVVRAGRTVSTTALRLLDADERTVVTAHGLHMTPQPVAEMPTPAADRPRVAAAVPGPFPLDRVAHEQTMFRHSTEMRYPAGEDEHGGPTTVWMRTIALLADEHVSGFSRICPLADCGNAVSRNAEPDRFAFMNTDLTVAIHREPVGDWFGMRAISRWERDGFGIGDAMLFDDEGPVGRAIQTLLIRPRPS